MEFQINNLPEAIRSTKKLLRQALPNYAATFREVEAEIRRRVDIIVRERESGVGLLADPVDRVRKAPGHGQKRPTHDQ